MIDYPIEVDTRRCSVSGRELQPGERFYGVLVQEGNKLVRKDYAAESWQGPPQGAFSFWAGRVPLREQSPRPKIDDELLCNCFQRLGDPEDEGRVNFRFVVALLLMRRKRLRFEEAVVEEDREVLCLRDSRTRELYRVLNPRLADDQIQAVQDEVFQVLGWE
jgi:hypothetical protein